MLETFSDNLKRYCAQNALVRPLGFRKDSDFFARHTNTINNYKTNTYFVQKLLCCVASRIFNESISADYLNNVRAVNGIVNENIFN